MKPEQAWNELDLAVKAAVEERGHVFLGAEFAKPADVIDGTPPRVALDWHVEIEGRHAMLGARVSSEFLDDTVVIPIIVEDVVEAMSRLGAAA